MKECLWRIAVEAKKSPLNPNMIKCVLLGLYLAGRGDLKQGQFVSHVHPFIKRVQSAGHCFLH